MLISDGTSGFSSAPASLAPFVYAPSTPSPSTRRSYSTFAQSKSGYRRTS